MTSHEHWLAEAKRIGFQATIEHVDGDNYLLRIEYKYQRRTKKVTFDLSDEGEVQTAIFRYAYLDQLYANRRKSQAKADAYHSVGMVRTPYGWE